MRIWHGCARASPACEIPTGGYVRMPARCQGGEIQRGHQASGIPRGCQGISASRATGWRYLYRAARSREGAAVEASQTDQGGERDDEARPSADQTGREEVIQTKVNGKHNAPHRASPISAKKVGANKVKFVRTTNLQQLIKNPSSSSSSSPLLRRLAPARWL